jgi:hypothetical protein
VNKQKNSLFVIIANIKDVFSNSVIASILSWFVLMAIMFWNESLYKSVNLLERWSFRYIDVPWTPPPTTPVPIWLEHYFGDFQLPVLFSSVSNPYNDEWPLSPGLPAPLVFLKVFLLFPLNISFLLFLIASLAVFIFGVKELIGIKGNKGLLIASTLSVLNLPIFIAADRGNFLILSLGLIFLVVSRVLFGDGTDLPKYEWYYVLLFAVSASFKLYYFALIPLFCILNYKRFAIKSIGMFLLINLISVFLIADDIFSVAPTIISGLGTETGSKNPMWILGGIGLPSLPANLLYISLDEGAFLEVISTYRYIFLSTILCWYFLIIYFVRQTNFRSEYKIIWILTTLQFAAPTAMAYTALWAVSGFAILLRVLSSQTRLTKLEVKNFQILLFAMVVTLSPNPWIYWAQLIPGVWIIVACLQVFLIRKNQLTSN